MKIIRALLLLIVSHSTMTVFTSDDDLHKGTGVNFQTLYAQKHYELTMQEKECNQRVSDLNKQVDHLKDQLNKLTNALQEANDENKSLVHELERCKKNNNGIEILNVQIHNLTATNKQLNNKKEQLEVDVQKIAAMLVDKNKENYNLKAIIQKDKQQINELNITIDTNKTTIENYKIKIDQLNIVVQQCKDNKDADKKTIFIIEELKTKFDQVIGFKTELEIKYKTQSEIVQKLVADLNSKINIEAFVKDLHRELGLCKAQNEKLNKNVNELNAVMQKNLTEFNMKTDEMNTQIYKIKDQLDDCHQEQST